MTTTTTTITTTKHGAALAELAIVAPLLLFILIGTVDLGRRPTRGSRPRGRNKNHTYTRHRC